MSNARFKFRVWSEKLKRYYWEMQLTVDGDLIPSKWLEPNSIPDLGRIVIEHCTGLTDENGRLIFEGDVFEATVLNSCDCDENIGKRIRGQVAYFTDCACFTFAAYSPINLGQIEIIGNIHDDQFREVTNMVEEI